MTIKWAEVAHIDQDGIERQAFLVPWSEVSKELGNVRRGHAEDLAALKNALLKDGAPEWIRDAKDWIDAFGWGLIGPEVTEEVGMDFQTQVSGMNLAEAKAAYLAAVVEDDILGEPVLVPDEAKRADIFEHIVRLIAEDDENYDPESDEPEPDWVSAAQEYLERQD